MGESTTVAHALLTIVAITLATTFGVAMLGRLGYIQSAIADFFKIKTNMLRTNIRIITGFYNETEGMYVIYVKNVGAVNIPLSELNKTDVYLGPYGGEIKLYYYGNGTLGTWTASDVNKDGSWESGETLIIKVNTGARISESVYVKIVLPSGASDEAVIPG